MQQRFFEPTAGDLQNHGENPEPSRLLVTLRNRHPQGP
jgi:hypothetical protein